MFCVLYKRKLHFLRSFAFFCVLYKRTLRSFTFFIKECCVLCVLLRFLLKNAKERCALFGFISHTKVTNLSKKECNTKNFFSIYYTYISIFIYIYLYIYILKKKNEGWACILSKRTQHSCIFLRSCKRTLRFLCSLCSLEKNAVFFAFFSVL